MDDLVAKALQAARQHFDEGGFLESLRGMFSGDDYQSTGDKVVKDGEVQWGDPESAADFFKADRALRLAREVQAPVTSSVPDRAPLTAPRPGPVEVQELPVNIPFAAPERGANLLSSDISPASVTSLPLAYTAAPAPAPAATAIDKLTARVPQDVEPTTSNARILAAIRANESRNNPRAQNPSSSAGGLYQFLNSTWGNTLRRMDPERFGAYNDRQLRGLKTDPNAVDIQHAAANYHLTNDIAPRLSKAGVPLTPGSAYLSWFQGPGGAVRAYTAPDDATVAQVFPKTVSANANMRFNGKPYAQWTMSDLRQWADTAMAKRMGRAHGGLVDDALHVVREHHADGEAVGQAEEPRPLTIYRGNAPVADEAGGSGREPAPAPPAFSYMPLPESVERQAARQPAYNPAERTWSDAGSTEGERLTRALGVEGELPKGETFMSAQPSGWDKYKPQRVPGTFLKRWGEAADENIQSMSEGYQAAKQGNYGAGALGMIGGALGAAISPLTGMERVLVRDPYLRMTGNLKDAQAAEMAADVALTGGLRGMVKPFAKAGNLEKLAAEPVTSAYRLPSPAATGAATAAGAMLAPDEAEASKLSKAMEVARMAIPRELSPLGFYSHGAEAARGLAQAKGTPEQFAAMLQKSGVKGPEMEGFLKTFGGRPIVTQDEAAQYFKGAMPQVEETVLGDKYSKLQQLKAREDEISSQLRNLDLGHDEWLALRKEGEVVQNKIDEISVAPEPKFSQYTLPGGENYREIALTLPGEEIYRAPVGHSMGDKADVNRVVHLRMSDRTGPNGEKILHVEEIQSDWGQKGKKEGFRNPDDNMQDLVKEYDYLTKQRRALEVSVRNGDDAAPATQAAVSRLTEVNNQMQALSDRMTAVRSNIPTAPYVTNTQAWTDLALKRALREAAEGGYDKLVWTPGAEQAKRYSLSNQVDRLQYVKNDDGTYAVIPYKDNRPLHQIERDNIPEKELESLFGRDVAEKMRAYEGDVDGNARSLSGQNLEVGGSGMKGYYDKIVPNQLSKLVKKLDPEAKIGTYDLVTKKGGKVADEAALNENSQLIEQGRFWDDARGENVSGYRVTSPGGQELGVFEDLPDAHDALAQALGSAKEPDTILKTPSLTITPAMREAIMKGQTAFKDGGSVVDRALMLVSKQA
jgi:hypothetical protein